MRVQLLGTAGYHPNETRQTSCLFLPEVGVVLDAGTGLFRLREKLSTESLDIFLTHVHLDHVVGLTYLFDVLVERPLARVTVHAAVEKLAAIQSHLLSEHLFPVALPCDYAPLTGPVTLKGDGILRAFPLIHPGGSLGFRLDWPGHSLAYITDTTADPAADYVREIDGVDLLLHECNFADGFEQQARLTGHSTLSSVARVAAAANVSRCVLVHLNPLDHPAGRLDLDAARRIFPALSIGTDGQEVEF
ncbi:MAG: MBL fold metallo-hydrolase [Pirellulales bacterium]|nr:MBL fold metallo-hydrolase [Pirellulales bacterium]